MSRRRRSKLQRPPDPQKLAELPSKPGESVSRRPDRKTHQLCRQVADTLNYVLSGETGDDVLRGLYVDSVVPFPDASRLLVGVAPLDPMDATPSDVYLLKLGALSGKLRSEIAASISRRRTPDLAYHVTRPTAPEVE